MPARFKPAPCPSFPSPVILSRAKDPRGIVRSLGFFARLRMTVLGMVLFSGVFAHAAEPEMHLSSKKVRDEVRAVVEAQLAALRIGDFATAYDFAARPLRRQFDERLFALMIKR